MRDRSCDRDQSVMNDFQIREALGRLRDRVAVPPQDAAEEAALLSAFDAHWARPPRRRRRSRVWMAATAASLAIAAALDWMVATSVVIPAGESRAMTAVVPDTAAFVAWPGAGTPPRFESGALMRIELPVSALPALGLVPPSSGSGSVMADVIVGQDGMARAVRLVQQ